MSRCGVPFVLFLLALACASVAGAARVDPLRLPIVFEENQGQAPPDVRFLARDGGQVYGFTRDTIELAGEEPVRLRLIGGSLDAVLEALDLLPGMASYYHGPDPRRWLSGLPTFGRIAYRDIFPGVDLVVHGTGGELEYDFVLVPGADPGAIRLRIEGAECVEVDPDGNLDAYTRSGDRFRQRRPRVFGGCGGGVEEVAGAYRLGEEGELSFEVGGHDARAPLVIDPILEYSTYLGGSDQEFGNGIGVDGEGRAVIAGQTRSLDFPVCAPGDCEAWDGDHNGAGFTDTFITKLTADGTGRIYSTYFGGSRRDDGHGVAVGVDGAAYAFGRTNSPDLPTTPTAVQSTYGTSGDAWVARFSSETGALQYSTYLGGAGGDEAWGLAVDPLGSVFVVGWTDSADFPLRGPLAGHDVRSGPCDAFVLRLEPFDEATMTGGALGFSTYLGGSGGDCQGVLFERAAAVASDGSGRAFVTGNTPSVDFPTTPGVVLPNPPGGQRDAFVAIVDTQRSELVASTYLGGTGDDYGFGIDLDGAGGLYVGGTTGSRDFPQVSSPRGFAGGTDAYVTHLSPDLSSIVYSTLIGGQAADLVRSLDVHPSGHTLLAGDTYSRDFPLFKALQYTYDGVSRELFLAALDPSGSELVFSTYLGGPGNDQASQLVRDVHGNGFLVATTDSDFPVTPGAFQASLAGSDDAVVARIQGIVTVDMTPSRDRALPFEPLSFTVRLANLLPYSLSDVEVEVTLDSCLDLSGFDPAQPGDLVVTPGPSATPTWTAPLLTVVFPTIPPRGSPGAQQAIVISDIARNVQDPQCCETTRVSHQTNNNVLPITAVGCLQIGGCPGCQEPACVSDLQVVRAGGGVALSWGPATAADHYHVWKVVSGERSLITEANQHAGVDPRIVAACAETPSTGCVDPAAIASSPALTFYQVRGACTCPSTHLEGIGHLPDYVCP